MKKEWFLYGLFTLMLGGLLWSRAILSISMGCWLLAGLFAHRQWLPSLSKDPLLIWSFIPIAIALLGCWQQPLATANYDFLLTLGTYPVAAITIRSIGHEQVINRFRQYWIGAVSIATLYPVSWYFLHHTAAFTRYGSGQSLPTFMDEDHVRFGIWICSALLFTWLSAYRYKKWILSFLLAALLLLAVRTAWVSLGVLLFTLLAFAGKKANRSNSKKIFITAGILTGAILLAILLFPTVQQKIAYTLYDWQQYNPATYNPNFSDGVRRALNQAAFTAVQSGGANTGWAAIPTTLEQYFQQQHPGVTSGFGWPFNQWLLWWMGSGWWGMLLFTLWLLYPAWLGWRNNRPAITGWTLVIAASCLIESTIAYQYGAWLHAWGLALCWPLLQKHTATNQTTL